MSERIEIGTEGALAERLLPTVKALVIPRPIAWVSTRSADGTDNLAPHSFFTVVSERPPIVAFSSIGRKDTLRNIEATGEFVVNVTPAALFEQINATSTDYPPGVSEFDAVGLRRERSAVVAPPRVAESPAALECRLRQEPLAIGNGFLVLGDVVHAAVSTAAWGERGPTSAGLDPIARLGRDEWADLGEVRAIRRIPWASLADQG